MIHINDDLIQWKDDDLGRVAIHTFMKQVVGTTLRLEKMPPTHLITITFLEAAKVRELNRRFRKIDRTTDILSFPMEEWLEVKKGKRIFCLGDLVISLETARGNARRYRTSLKDELKRLLIHGTLHLLGYDHQKPTERSLMRARETTLSQRHLKKEDLPTTLTGKKK